VGQTNQWSPFGPTVGRAILRRWIGGGPGVEPAGLPFWVICYNNIYIYIYIWNLCNFWNFRFWSWICLFGHQIWRGLHQIWRAPNPFFFFEILVFGPHWAFSHCHVAAHDWATWQPTIGPRQPLAQSPPHHTPCHIMATCICHVTIRSATWLYGLPRGTFSLVHMIDPKMPKMSDTWQPLVLATSCCHDIIMTHVTLLHVPHTLVQMLTSSILMLTSTVQMLTHPC
jgi:hypothetical protein